MSAAGIVFLGSAPRRPRGGRSTAPSSPKPTAARGREDRKTWTTLLVAAGVRPARLHDARHTAATLMLQQGVAARVAMQLLGHSQISMTMHYTHVVPELNAEAAARMNDALWGDTETGSD